MVTKGIIKSIDLLGNTCTVHIPFFETAGNDPIIETATVSNTPGSYNGYKIGDVVYVAFEDGSMSNPVIIGKLYLGTEKEKADPRGVLNVEESSAAKKATLPADATLASNVDPNVPNTTTPYNSLFSIANGLNRLNTEVAQNDRDYGNRFKQVSANTEGIRSELLQEADKIRGEISSTKADLEGVISDTKTVLEVADGKISAEVNNVKIDLEGRITENSTNITANADAITLEATTREKAINGVTAAYQAAIDVTSKEITAKVEKEISDRENDVNDINRNKLDSKNTGKTYNEGDVIKKYGFGWDLNDEAWTIKAYDQTKDEGLPEDGLDIFKITRDSIVINAPNVKLAGYPKVTKVRYAYGTAEDNGHPNLYKDVQKKSINDEDININETGQTGWTETELVYDSNYTIWQWTQTAKYEYNESNETWADTITDTVIKLAINDNLIAVNTTINSVNEELSQGIEDTLAVAQGKTTNYYSKTDPSEQYTIKEGDCWFKTIDSGDEYNNELGGEQGKLYQWNGTQWEDIGGELVANKLTATYINALDITAQAINIPGKFKASNLEENSPVEIGGFAVEDDKLYYYDENHEYDYGGTMQKGTGVGIGAVPNEGSWAFWAGTQTGDGVEIKAGGKGAYGHDAPFRVGHDGALFATRGEISGFELTQQDNKPVFKSKKAPLIDSISNVSGCYTTTRLGNYGFNEVSSKELTLKLNAINVTNKYKIFTSTNSGKANSVAVMKLTFTKKLPNFSFYIVSSSENNNSTSIGAPNDYILASTLNAENAPSSANDTRTFVSTLGNSVEQSSGIPTLELNGSMPQVVKVAYTDIRENDFCYIVFRKDSATNSYLDKGWIIIPNTLDTGEFEFERDNWIRAESVWITPQGSRALLNETDTDNWGLSVGANFGVTLDGDMYATSGKIGGFSISTDSLTSGSKISLEDDEEPGVYLGPDGISIGTGFKVKAGEAGSTKVMMSTEVLSDLSAVSYWLSSTCTVHKGLKHGENIVITAMKKIGQGAEEVDTDAYLWWRYKNATKANGESSDWVIAAAKYRINFTFPDKVLDDDILIIATHLSEFDPNTGGVDISTDEEIYEREEIPFSPLNTPTLNLTNDNASIAYNGNTKVTATDTVSTTAGLWLNGSEMPATDVVYSWSLVGCKTNTGLTAVTDSAELTIKELSANTATAECTATVTAEGLFKGKTYTKIFTITKQLKGDPGAASTVAGPAGRAVLSTTKYYKLLAGTPSDITSSYTNENPPTGWKTSPDAFNKATDTGKNYWETVRTKYSDNTYSWSTPVQNSMLTVDFINSLGITAEKIDVGDAFSADSTTNEVKVGGFIVTDGSIYSDNQKFYLGSDGVLYATDAILKGEVTATSGKLGAFTITAQGLESDDYIKLTAESIYFPKQTVFNLANDVTIHSDSSTSYLITGGDRHFEIKNKGGAGLRFNANDVTSNITQNINLSAFKITVESTTEDLGEGYEHTYYSHFLDISWSISNSGVLHAPEMITLYIRYTYDYPGGAYGAGAYTKTENMPVTLTIPALTNSGSFKHALGLGGVPDYYTWHGWGKSDSTNNSDFHKSTLSYSTVAVNETNNMLYSLGHLCPNVTGTGANARYTPHLLGDDNHVWKGLRVETSPSIGSDRRIKNNINKISEDYDNFFDGLKPSTFKYNTGESGRSHVGFIAQEVEESLIAAGFSTLDFAGLCISKNEVRDYALRYDEFIALNTDQIQKLKKRVADQEARIAELEEIVKNLKTE